MSAQDKSQEVAFFDDLAGGGEYDVFSPGTNEKIVGTCLQQAGLRPPARVLDLGCGSGVFTNILAKRGFSAIGVDISPAMVRRAQVKYPAVEFAVGDAEKLPFPDGSFDGVLLSGLLHHFPDPSACLNEVRRVLKAGGVFAAFDPNRQNPFMYLYRDRSSPLYSSKGVSPNERPVLPRTLAGQCRGAGFENLNLNFLGNVSYRYVASPLARCVLPLYNTIDRWAFSPKFLAKFRAFVVTTGQTPVVAPGRNGDAQA